MKNRKKNTKLVLILLLVCITLGYAALRTGLNINGTANVTASSWSVYFDNYQNSQNTNITPTTEPTITGTTTTSISYVVNLVEPGDMYEFTVDVVNGGSIDALISIVSKLGENEIGQGNAVPDYLDYVVTDGNGDAIVNNHRLNGGNTETVKVKVLYKTDIDPEDLPGTNQQLVFDLELEATQAPKEVAPVAAEDYVVTTTTMNIGQTLPQGITLKTAANAKADWVGIAGSEKPFYLKQVLNGSDEISESYACFERNNTEYCLKGGDSGVAFLSNAKIIYDAFEGEGCYSDGNEITDPYSASYNPNPSSLFYCGVSGLDAHAYSDGDVYAYDDGCSCDVYSDGSSICNHYQQ